MSSTAKLNAILGVFASLSPQGNAYHYQAPDNTEVPYIVWAEDDRVDLLAGNSHAEKAWQGTIDLYTHTEADGLIDTIEELLEGSFSWRLESVQFEEDTRLIHYEWVWTYA